MFEIGRDLTTLAFAFLCSFHITYNLQSCPLSREAFVHLVTVLQRDCEQIKTVFQKVFSLQKRSQVSDPLASPCAIIIQVQQTLFQIKITRVQYRLLQGHSSQACLNY